MQEVIKEIWSNKFLGFYETPFLNSDEFIDMESEDKDQLKDIINKDIEFNLYYEYEDIDQYIKDVIKYYMEAYVELIRDRLPYYITSKDFFKFELVEDSCMVDSPKYYNYSTDKAGAQIKTNIETLNLIKWYVLNLEGANQYIINNFTLRDGFVSFISNDINTWKQTNIKDYEVNLLSALFEMFLYLDDSEFNYNLAYDVLENVCKYEYITPVIEYNYKHYNYNEFLNLLKVAI